ncbi:MAG: DnaJ domain-containing protein [Spirochaetia bacterium]|jgi:curved DNA-binding protein CbpA
MDDGYFREILGVTEDATRDQIRKAYRQRVMENHPDRFPSDKKALQELATITLTEAYNALMCAVRPGAPRADGPSRPREDAAHAPAGKPAAAPVSAVSRSAVALHRDPGYAYYKQGFINFSLAIHGIADVNRHIAAGRIPRFTRRYTASEYFGSSLAFLRAAHGYFARVVEKHPDSVWASDARWKLRRIEQFSQLYRRILRNMTGK